MIVIGIVGPPAGGKSTVARQLMALGAVWLDADALAHQVLEQAEVQEKLRQRFGPQVVRDGQVDRKWLASQVFGADQRSREQLEWLEAIIHPPTRLLLQKQLVDAAHRQAAVVLLDVPLLFESGWDVYCDAIWCLDAPLAKRIEWARHRGWTADDLRSRESRQLPLAEKRRRSTHILHNIGDLGELARRVQQLWLELLSRPPSSTDNRHCDGSSSAL